jgi:hypothetical protein
VCRFGLFHSDTHRLNCFPKKKLEGHICRVPAAGQLRSGTWVRLLRAELAFKAVAPEACKNAAHPSQLPRADPDSCDSESLFRFD